MKQLSKLKTYIISESEREDFEKWKKSTKELKDLTDEELWKQVEKWANIGDIEDIRKHYQIYRKALVKAIKCEKRYKELERSCLHGKKI